MKTVILIGLLIGSSAFAGDLYYMVNGKRTDATHAILAAASGDETYKCQPVVVKISKTGTSVSLRNKPKKLTKDQIEAKIKDLKSRGE